MVQLKNIIIGLIFAGYLLCYKELVFAQVKKLLNAFLKRDTIKKIGSAVRTTDKTFGQYLIGTFLDAIIVGILTATALIIFKIPYVPLISVLIACTNIIPIFGPFIGAIPSFIFIFIASPLKAIWFVAIMLVIQQIDGNIIAPRVLGGTTGLPAIAVITAITIMGGLFGVGGMIIGVPVFALIGKFLHTKTEQKALAKALAGGEADNSNVSFEIKDGDDDIPGQLKFVIEQSENVSEQSGFADKNPESFTEQSENAEKSDTKQAESLTEQPEINE
jgi:predicted PurR-regulated permease PerM